MIVGGYQQDGTSEVNIFNLSTGQWEHLTNIPAARAATAVVGVADNIIMIGGGVTDNDTDNDEHSNTVWIGVFE